jgi:hypothetical protein
MVIPNNKGTSITKGKEKNGGRIELIATSYESLKAWTLGINMLLQQLENKIQQ